MLVLYPALCVCAKGAVVSKSQYSEKNRVLSFKEEAYSQWCGKLCKQFFLLSEPPGKPHKEEQWKNMWRAVCYYFFCVWAVKFCIITILPLGCS